MLADYRNASKPIGICFAHFRCSVGLEEFYKIIKLQVRFWFSKFFQNISIIFKHFSQQINVQRFFKTVLQLK